MKKRYQENEGMLSSYRLHILLPLNAAVKSKLEEDDNNVRFHGNLPELTIDRAGVRKRVYKHSIYKIVNIDKDVRNQTQTTKLHFYNDSPATSPGFDSRVRRSGAFCLEFAYSPLCLCGVPLGTSTTIFTHSPQTCSQLEMLSCRHCLDTVAIQ